MLFESPTQVGRDPNVERASVGTRKDVDDRSACHGDTYYIPPRLLGSGMVSPLRPSALGRDDGKSSSRPRRVAPSGETLLQRLAVTPACSPPLSRAPCSSRLRP